VERFWATLKRERGNNVWGSIIVQWLDDLKRQVGSLTSSDMSLLICLKRKRNRGDTDTRKLQSDIMVLDF